MKNAKSKNCQHFKRHTMKHTFLLRTKVRTGVIRGLYCYQPFLSGRLRKAVPLFQDTGSLESNQAFFEANFETVIKENGDVLVLKKEVRSEKFS